MGSVHIKSNQVTEADPMAKEERKREVHTKKWERGRLNKKRGQENRTVASDKRK